MKIENTYTNYDIEKKAVPTAQVSSAEALKQGASESRQQPLDNNKNNEDTVVTLSTASKEALLMTETIANTPDIRQEKVQALKEKIAADQYPVDAQAIADKMVDHFTNDMGFI